MHLFSCPSHAYIYIWHTYIPAISDNNNRWGSWSKEVCGFPCWRLTCQASLLWPQWQQICQVTMILHLGRVEHGGYGYVMILIWMIILYVMIYIYGWFIYINVVKGSLKAIDNIFLSNCHIVLWIFGKVREFIPRFGVVDRCPTPFFELIVMLMGNRPVFGCNLAFMDCVHIVYHFAKWWRKVLTFWLKKHGVEESGGGHSFVGSDNFPDNLVFLVVASPNTTPPRKIKEVSYQPYHTVSSASTWTHLDATKSHKDASGFKIDRLQTQSQPQYIG